MAAQTAPAQANREGRTGGYDRLIDALCMLGSGAVFLLLAVRWPALPAYIPIHMENLASMDTKTTLLSLPFLAVLAYAFLTLLRPTAAALPLWKPAEHNRVPIQKATVSLLSSVKLWTVALLLVPAADRICIATAGKTAFHPLILPLTGVCLCLSILGGVKRIRRLRHEPPQAAALEPGEAAIPLAESAVTAEAPSEDTPAQSYE